MCLSTRELPRTPEEPIQRLYSFATVPAGEAICHLVNRYLGLDGLQQHTYYIPFFTRRIYSDRLLWLGCPTPPCYIRHQAGEDLSDDRIGIKIICNNFSDEGRPTLSDGSRIGMLSGF